MRQVKKTVSSFLAILMIFGLFVITDNPAYLAAETALQNTSYMSSETFKKGDTISITCRATGSTGFYQYAAYYKKTTDEKWTTLQKYGANVNLTFTPAEVVDYDVCIKVKDNKGAESKKYFVLKANNNLVNNSVLSKTSIKLGESITATGSATGGTGSYQYQILYKRTSQTKWTVAQNYNANSVVSFKPTASTTYDVCVKVKDSSGTEVKKFFTVQVTNGLQNTSKVSSQSIKLGEIVTVTAAATGGTGKYTYAVYYKKDYDKKWTTKQDYKTNNTVSVKPAKQALYNICVKVKDSDGTIVKKYFDVTVSDSLQNISTISSDTIKLGETLKVSCSAKGGSGFYQYAVYYKKQTESKWTTKQDYSSNVSVSIKPTKATQYDICIKVKDDKGTIDKKYFVVSVTNDNIVIPEEEKYTITYNIAGNDNYLKKLEINNPNRTTYTKNDSFILQPITIEGYNWDGWYNVSGEKITQIKKGTTGDITLWAKFGEKELYHVYFDSPLVPYNDTNTITRYVSDTTPLRNLKWDGYVFVGWSDDNGKIIKEIKPGTTDIQVHANWMSERNKAWAKKDIGSPIIIESEETSSLLFIYEIGRIENVPLQVIEDFGYINSEGVTKTISKEYSIITDVNLMKQYTKTVADSTTNTAQWSLSSDWTNSVTVSENYLKENNISETDAKTLCTTDNKNWLVSSGSSGATTTTTYDSAQEYNLNTATGNTKTYDTHDESGSKTHKQSAELKLSAKEYAEVGASGDIGVAKIEGKVGVELNQELDIGYEGSRTKSSSDKTGTETDEGSQDQTGSIKHTGTDTVSNVSWNNSSSYGGSKTISNTDSVSKTVAERIASEYGYGRSYIGHDGETNSQGTSTSISNSNAYSSAVTYCTEEAEKETITYTTSNTKTGYHRLIKAGTAHVFAMVGYDIKTASYFVTTYTVMDDESHDFEDYSYSTSKYDDNQISIIPFEIPYEVEEYVLSKIGESEGLEFSKAGKVTGYNGTEKNVIIPEYHVFNNQDGTKSAVKITSISPNAFKNNKNITGIQLSDYISEIPDNAFEGCTSLANIIMPNVTSIGKEAFKNCSGFDTVFLSKKIERIGNDAFKNLDTFVVYTNNKNVVECATNSGAKNIVIYADSSNGELNGSQLVVGNETEIFAFNGRGNTFNDFTINSDATITVINNAKINSNVGIPLKVSSSEVQLGQVDITSSGISMILMNENCNLDLYGESSITSTIGNALLCKNVAVLKTSAATEEGIFTELKVNDNVLVCGDITNKSLINYNGHIIDISEKEYAKYSNGTYTLRYNANGGIMGETSKTVYYGEAYGTLPTPTKDCYSFDGWFTAQNGGTKINSDDIFTGDSDVTIYAHWTKKTFTATFNANGGYTPTTQKSVTYSENYGTLPTPSRNYYEFLGWYTQAVDGNKITSNDVFMGNTDITLYAHWKIHDLSGWVPINNMPSDGQIVNRKWTYTEKSYKDSRNEYEPGYTLASSEWIWCGSNSRNYADFPSGFDTGNWYYQNWNSGAFGAYENNTSKRTVSNSWSGYIYWHWMYDCGGSNAYTRAIWNQSGYCPANTYGYKYFGAFDSTTNYGVQGYNQYCNSCGMTTYKVTDRPSNADSQGSYFWFRFDYYTSTYNDYYKLFHYYKEDNKESYSQPQQSSTIYNITEWVQYRAK